MEWDNENYKHLEDDDTQGAVTEGPESSPGFKYSHWLALEKQERRARNPSLLG